MRNAEIAREILGGEKGPKREIVIVNAAAGLVASGIAKDLRRGVELAEKAIESGAAQGKLHELQRRFPIS
jgi:anthranilate phosphoribosyltransferase